MTEKKPREGKPGPSKPLMTPRASKESERVMDRTVEKFKNALRRLAGK